MVFLGIRDKIFSVLTLNLRRFNDSAKWIFGTLAGILKWQEQHLRWVFLDLPVGMTRGYCG